MIQDLKNNHQQLVNALYLKLGKKEALEKQVKTYQDRLTVIESETLTLTKASLFLQTLSDTTRQEIINKISIIITDALQKVKDSNLEFKMVLATERNQVDVKFFVLDKQTKQEYDILNSCGGTIADLVTFPLRVALLMKWSPTLSRLLVMDENFKFVSVSDQDLLGEFVKQITEKLDLQVILITHSEKLASKSHKIFEVRKVDGISVVEEKL